MEEDELHAGTRVSATNASSRPEARAEFGELGRGAFGDDPAAGEKHDPVTRGARPRRGDGSSGGRCRRRAVVRRSPPRPRGGTRRRARPSARRGRSPPARRRTRARPRAACALRPRARPICRRATSMSAKRSSRSSVPAGNGKCARTRSTISRTRSVGGKPDSCGVTPTATRAAAARGSRPKSWALPVSGRRSPSRIESAVVFPAPFGPSSASDFASVDRELDLVERDGLAEPLRDSV